MTPGYDRKTGMACDPQSGLMYNPDNFVSRNVVTNWLVANSVHFRDGASVKACVENAHRMKDIYVVSGYESRAQAEKGWTKYCVLAVACKEE